MTPARARREIYEWGGHIKIDKNGNVMTVTADKFDNKLLQKAYKKWCKKINSKGTTLKTGKKYEYMLRFG